MGDKLQRGLHSTMFQTITYITALDAYISWNGFGGNCSLRSRLRFFTLNRSNRLVVKSDRNSLVTILIFSISEFESRIPFQVKFKIVVKAKGIRAGFVRVDNSRAVSDRILIKDTEGRLRQYIVPAIKNASLATFTTKESPSSMSLIWLLSIAYT
ncbi:hypothetical protein BGZ63DRAFT_391084 [Mariannaea sp. PMI_226]|nr:hypothetical protein BGZ63DRAFT_391084 [Mariannaea sp. PMI_226]